MMKRYRYRGRVLFGEYLRAALGLAMTTGPLMFLDPAPSVAVVLGGLTLLFGLFALRTGFRQFTVMEVTAEDIASRGPVSCRIAWPQVTRLRLDYFRTRRDRKGGWMQLKIRSRDRTIRIDSMLEGFDEIAVTAAAIARKNAIPLSDTTVANYRAIGVSLYTGDPEIAA